MKKQKEEINDGRFDIRKIFDVKKDLEILMKEKFDLFARNSNKQISEFKNNRTDKQFDEFFREIIKDIKIFHGDCNTFQKIVRKHLDLEEEKHKSQKQKIQFQKQFEIEEKEKYKKQLVQQDKRYKRYIHGLEEHNKKTGMTWQKRVVKKKLKMKKLLNQIKELKEKHKKLELENYDDKLTINEQKTEIHDYKRVLQRLKDVKENEMKEIKLRCVFQLNTKHDY